MRDKKKETIWSLKLIDFLLQLHLLEGGLHFDVIKTVNAIGNLVPRVLSLPRESTLVVAGHVSMYTNQIRIGGGSLTLSMEVKVALLLYLSELFQRSCLTAALVLSIQTFRSVRCWLRGKFVYFQYCFFLKITVDSQLRISVISFSQYKNYMLPSNLRWDTFNLMRS